MSLQEFTSERQLVDHYAAVRDRLMRPPSTRPIPVPVNIPIKEAYVARIAELEEELHRAKSEIARLCGVAVTEIGEIEQFTPYPSIALIIRVTALQYEIAGLDLVSKRRTAGIVLPRQVAMYLAKKLTPRSLPEIGRMMGNRDHTTVLHAVRKIESLRRVDMDLNGEILKIIETIRQNNAATKQQIPGA